MVIRPRRLPAAALAAFALAALFFALAARGGMGAGRDAVDVSAKDGFIKWVDFTPPYWLLKKTLDLDVGSRHVQGGGGDGAAYDWIGLLAYLGAKYGGDFKRCREKDLTALTARLDAGETIESITCDMKNFGYYMEAYTAVLGGFVGGYRVQTEGPDGEKVWQERYGLKAFSPVAKGYYYNDYDDFGVSRTYGYRRRHLGHDLMGSVGTPIIAVESGTVEELGWNQYGGWRVGIRSFDGKRYYYYAHMRRGRPYHASVEKGETVTAGDVIGYMGRTGYSLAEDVNNIEDPHLHIGMQLIFDESQKEGSGEIWIDMYAITRLLSHNRSAVYRDENKEYHRTYAFEETRSRFVEVGDQKNLALADIKLARHFLDG
ncbi:MAG: M23 family metallopeptidase [Oscillospiraceae bacterium]|nr:M23 family metallopeptidase [Oscillospiraceae bacterium]